MLNEKKVAYMRFCADLITVANQLKRTRSVRSFIRGFAGLEDYNAQAELLKNLYVLKLVNGDDITQVGVIKWVGVYR